MKEYLVRFKPLEPYFFGNEKSFLYPGAQNQSQLSNRYFIKSEIVPSQTTLFGAIRFLLLPHHHSDFSEYTEEEKKANNECVGANSFSFAKSEPDSFGKIKKMSPVFLCHGEDILVPVPLDHIEIKSRTEAGEPVYNEKYTPFKEYKSAKGASDKEVWYTEEYDSKEGLSEAFLNLADGKIVRNDELFTTSLRVGINRAVIESGFFKKKYCSLDKNYSFGVFVTLADDLVPENSIVFLGQGKSSFAVEFTERSFDFEKVISPYLNQNTVYCLSDSFISGDIYEKSLFSAVKTKTYRAYTTVGGKVRKDSVLYTLVAAGSVFVVKNTDQFIESAKNSNATTIGYNTFITKK